MSAELGAAQIVGVVFRTANVPMRLILRSDGFGLMVFAWVVGSPKLAHLNIQSEYDALVEGVE